MENFLLEANWPVKGVDFLDFGASTGGFTDCLLQRGGGGSQVSHLRGCWPGAIALQVKSRSAGDKSGKNEPKILDTGRPAPPPPPPPPLSFIGDGLIFHLIAKSPQTSLGIPENQGCLAALVKPQFECKKEEADMGRGIIRDTDIHQRVLNEIKQFAREELAGCTLLIEILAHPSGNDGNKEFFLGWQSLFKKQSNQTKHLLRKVYRQQFIDCFIPGKHTP